MQNKKCLERCLELIRDKRYRELSAILAEQNPVDLADLLEGLPLFECMAAGARASAVTVSRLGAQQSIPTRAEVERVFDLDDLVQDGEAE